MNAIMEKDKTLPSTLDNQLQQLQAKYELQIKETAVNALKSSGKSSLLTNSNIQKVISEYNIDTKELLIEAKNSLDGQPNISDNDLAVKLLSKIACDKKYKGLCEIAKEMLAEKWWKKNV